MTLSSKLALGSFGVWFSMIFASSLLDFTDPWGTLGLIFSALVLFELVKMLDAENQMEHLGKRYKVYLGIIGKVGAGLGVVGSGVQRILGLFSRKKKKKTKRKRKKKVKKEIYQMEEEPEEWEGGIEG